MAPQENLKLDEILEQISEHRADFRVLSAELGVGVGEASDKPTGRIPRLETTQAHHSKRIRRMESVFLMVAGAVALLKGIAWGAGVLAHSLEVFKH